MFTPEIRRIYPHQLYYNLGCILQQQAELDQAADRYRRAILLSRQAGAAKTSADAHLNLGVVLAQQERWLSAIYHYRRSIALQSNPIAYCNLGTALLQQGETDAAIEIYQQAINLPQPQSNLIWANLYHHLGQALHKQRRLGEAIAAYRQALAIDASKPEIYYNLGRALHQQGDCAEAIDCFDRALQLDPSMTLALGEKAFACLTLGQFDRAMPLFRQAIAPDQALIIAYCNWIFALPVTDEFARARSAVAQFLSALLQGEAAENWLVQALTHWGNVLTAYGGEAQLRHAEHLYQYALQHQPQQIDLYRHLAQCLRQQQRFSAAIVTYRFALSIAPQDVALQTELVDLLQSSAPAPTPTPPCLGLNCEACLQKLTQTFEPVCLGEGVHQLSARSPLPSDSIDRSVTTFANGRIWVSPQTDGWQACRSIAVFSNGELMPQWSRSYPGQLPNCEHSDLPLQHLPASLPEPLIVSGKVAALSSLSGGVYFHWMIDLLPRLEILRRQIDLQQIDYFLVNSYQKSFQQETLQALGIRCDRIIESDRYSHLQAQELIIPEFAGSLGWAEPWAIEWLRNQFLPKAPANSQSPFIYLSRSDAHYRRLLNEDQVMNYLRSYGFVALTLDSLSVAEQADLFANAKVIVAPHGSSLTNLVFCQPETQVVELTSPHYLRHYFWRISRSLNLNHYIVRGKAISNQFLRQLIYPNPLLEDIWIDIDRLHFVMQKVLNGLIATQS